MKIRLTFLFISLCLYGKPAWAGDALTWEMSAQEAAKNNADLSAALEGVKSADALYSGAYSGFLPQLSLDGSYKKTNSSISGIGTTDTIRNNYTAGISATQQLFSGFRDSAKIQKTKSSFEYAKATLLLSKAKLGYDLKSAFNSLLYSQEQAKLAASIAKRREENLRLVNLRYEGGGENKGSYLLSKASLAQSRFDVEQANRSIRVAELQMAKALGRGNEAKIEVVGKLKWGTPARVQDFRTLAITTPEHLQSVAQVQMSEADIRIARSNFFPEIDLNGSVSRQGPSFPPDGNLWAVGVTLSFPFFPGTGNLFGFQSANAEARKAELTRKSTDDGLVVKLEQAATAYEDAVGQHEVAVDFLAAAQERATIARGKYRTGLMTFEDWDLIENDLINREKAELSGQRDSVLAEAAWEQAQGKSSIP